MQQNNTPPSGTPPSGTPPSGTPPDGTPSGSSGAPGGQNSSSVTHTGATELTESTTLSNQSYSSTNSA